MATRPAGAVLRHTATVVLVNVFALVILNSSAWARADESSDDSWVVDTTPSAPAVPPPPDPDSDQGAEWGADLSGEPDGEAGNGGEQSSSQAAESETPAVPEAESVDTTGSADWAAETGEPPIDTSNALTPASSDGTDLFAGSQTTGGYAFAPARADESVTFELAEVDGSGVAGTATLTATTDGGTRVDLDLEGTPESSAVALFAGSCAALAPDPSAILGQLGTTGVGQADLPSVPLADLRGTSAVVVYVIDGTTRRDLACGDVPEAAPVVESAQPPASGVTSTGVGTTAIARGTTSPGVVLAAIAAALLAVAVALRCFDSRSRIASTVRTH